MPELKAGNTIRAETMDVVRRTVKAVHPYEVVINVLPLLATGREGK